VRERAGQTVYRKRASFHSRGLAGHLYWHALLSRYAIVFGGMARNITRAASTPGRSPSVRKWSLIAGMAAVVRHAQRGNCAVRGLRGLLGGP